MVTTARKEVGSELPEVEQERRPIRERAKETIEAVRSTASRTVSDIVERGRTFVERFNKRGEVLTTEEQAALAVQEAQVRAALSEFDRRLEAIRQAEEAAILQAERAFDQGETPLVTQIAEGELEKQKAGPFKGVIDDARAWLRRHFIGEHVSEELEPETRLEVVTHTVAIITKEVSDFFGSGIALDLAGWISQKHFKQEERRAILAALRIETQKTMTLERHALKAFENLARRLGESTHLSPEQKTELLREVEELISRAVAEEEGLGEEFVLAFEDALVERLEPTIKAKEIIKNTTILASIKMLPILGAKHFYYKATKIIKALKHGWKAYKKIAKLSRAQKKEVEEALKILP